MSNFVLTQKLKHTQNESSTCRLKHIQYCNSKTIKLSQIASLKLPQLKMNILFVVFAVHLLPI